MRHSGKSTSDATIRRLKKQNPVLGKSFADAMKYKREADRKKKAILKKRGL